MDFFEQQEQSRRLGHLLVLLFALTIILIVGSVDAVVLLIVSLFHALHAAPAASAETFIDWGTVFWTSLCVLAFMGGASLLRTAQLRRGGGRAVARKLGATPIAANTGNPARRRLRNVVEEMAIASGVSVPDVFVMEKEGGINAFSAGYNISDAAICVTRGCLDDLGRDELQGLIAHEFSHILNGDVRLNIRLVGLLYGILAITIAGRRLSTGDGAANEGRYGVLGYRQRGERRGIGGALLVIGAIGLLFGHLIQAAVSRSREQLADASAVQFTRQRKGLAGSLKKILALPLGSTLLAANRQEVAHMLFSKGMPGPLLSTHPPLIRRIKALDPAFKTTQLARIRKDYHAHQSAGEKQRDIRDTAMGSSPMVAAMATEALTSKGKSPFEPGEQKDVHSNPPPASKSFTEQTTNAVFALGAMGAMGAANQGVTKKPSPHTTSGDEVKLEPAGISRNVARPDAEHMATASLLRKHIPETLAKTAGNRNFAPAVLFALILEREDASVQERQLETLRRPDTTAMAKKVESLQTTMAALHPLLRLPLASLAYPGLRSMPKNRLHVFLEQLYGMINADETVGFEEYCLATLVRVQVIEAMKRGARSGAGMRVKACAGNIRALFALTAAFGNRDEAAARRAFQKAVDEVFPGREIDRVPPTHWQKALDKAFDKLDRLRPADKQRVIHGLVRAVNDDGVVKLAEAELLRTACAALHCPLPPIIRQAPATP